MSLNRYFGNNNHGLGHPFFMSPGFDEFFTQFGLVPRSRQPTSMFDLMPVLSDSMPDGMSLLRSSPGYEISENDGKYQIQVDVPGIKASDMEVKLENDNHVLHISGGRKTTKEDGSTMETRFEKRFTVGDNIEIEKMQANLSDGVLTLTAPKKEVEKKDNFYKIAITEGPMDTDKKKTADA